MLNYNALQSELTLDYNERTALSSFRTFFSTVSSILCALLPPETVKALPDVRAGYITMGLVFGAFFALPLIATVFASRERKEFQRPPEPFDWRLAFLEPWKMRTFIWVLRLVFALVPIVLLLAALFFARRFPLTPEVHERLRRVLAVRRNGLPESDGIRQEAETLEKLLIGG